MEWRGGESGGVKVGCFHFLYGFVRRDVSFMFLLSFGVISFLVWFDFCFWLVRLFVGLALIWSVWFLVRCRLVSTRFNTHTIRLVRVTSPFNVVSGS